MSSTSRRPRASLLALCLVLAGCAHYVVNDPLPGARTGAGYRFDATETASNTNSLFVCLVFTGGGTRAAALSYGVLDMLRNTRIVWKGVEKSLLQEVDCISSISGGSFTAAYYGLFGDRIFTDFRSRFLDVDVEDALIRRAVNPLNWFRLASPYFSRIDLAAEYYHEKIFDKQPFSALAGNGKRPFVILNATNLANGERFEFTQEQFDFLVSDLATYPVARAVAASSAFPFLLSPLSLKNYPHPEGFTLPTDYEEGLKDYDHNRRRYYWARNRALYVNDKERPYLHLMDGGLADNIGLRPVEAAWRRTSGFIRKLLSDGAIEKFVIIVVNARPDSGDTISKKESPPGLGVVAVKTATIAMDNYSFETIEVMKELRDMRERAQRNIAACRQRLAACPTAPPLPGLAADIDPYVIEVNFEAIPDPERRKYFLTLPTSFTLSRDQVDALIQIGPELLRAEPEFKELMRSLGQP
ncbi:MAG TPA: patatin-like phospholipase family protein [Methylomirabilota bacterium]|nr:patatin-like phospholipase family protein [Methylomirabilota bacterium]